MGSGVRVWGRNAAGNPALQGRNGTNEQKGVRFLALLLCMSGIEQVLRRRLFLGSMSYFGSGNVIRGGTKGAILNKVGLPERSIAAINTQESMQCVTHTYTEGNIGPIVVEVSIGVGRAWDMAGTWLGRRWHGVFVRHKRNGSTNFRPFRILSPTVFIVHSCYTMHCRGHGCNASGLLVDIIRFGSFRRCSVA